MKTNAEKVIFGGDLNARDTEIKSLSPQVGSFKDNLLIIFRISKNSRMHGSDAEKM